MQKTITDRIKDAEWPYYNIIAGELTDDVANQHILTLWLRYLYYDGEKVQIKEGLLDFTYISRGTADHLVRTNPEQLRKCGLKVQNVRGHACDTTSVMQSKNLGLQDCSERTCQIPFTPQVIAIS